MSLVINYQSALVKGEALLTSEVPTVRSILRQRIQLKEEALLLQDVKRNLYPVGELVGFSSNSAGKME